MWWKWHEDTTKQSPVEVPFYKTPDQSSCQYRRKQGKSEKLWQPKGIWGDALTNAMWYSGWDPRIGKKSTGKAKRSPTDVQTS